MTEAAPTPFEPTAEDAAGARRLVAAAERLGVRDARVLAALAATPRRLFMAPGFEDQAYVDAPAPIGHGQTISQPSLVALMTEALELRPGDRVLEIGAGSGFQTALLCRLARFVHAIERFGELAQRARERLHALGLSNFDLRAGDGSLGWPDAAPFDRIIAAAAAEEPPPALLEQMAEGGVMLAPLGSTFSEQRLTRLRRADGGVTRETMGLVRFVPLIRGPAPGQR